MALSREKQKLFDDNIAIVNVHAQVICNGYMLAGITVDVEDIRQVAKETLYVLVNAYSGLPEHFEKYVNKLIPKMLKRYVVKYYSAKITMKDCGENCIDHVDEKLGLRMALLKLSEKDRTYIRMFYFENKTYSEIAEALNEGVDYVASCIESSLRQLRAELT